MVALGAGLAATSSAALPADPQRTALERLYQSTGGAHWTNRTNWLQGSFCTWYGVHCDQAGNVAQLSLSRNNLRYVRPPRDPSLRGATDCGWSCGSGIFPDVPELTHLKGIGILENSFLPQDIPANLWGLPRGLTAIWL